MFAKRVLLVLTIAATIAATVNGQSNDKGGWKAKMARKAQTNGAQSNTAPATNSSSKSSEDADDDDDNKGSLEGTWRAIETFDDGFSAKVLFTFGAGKNNGTVVHSDEVFFVPFPSCLNAQGVWKRRGERRFVATDEAFCFDTSTQPFTFDPFGKVKFDSVIRLNSRGNEFNGTLHIEGFLADGTSFFTSDATLHGVRMRTDVP